jgi:sulfur-carrier protein adenylyltransferase/sulfurtransferase
MVYFDTLSDRDYVRMLKIRKDPKCPVCGEHPTQTGLIDYEAFCGLAPASGMSAHDSAPANGASANAAAR